MSSLKQRDVRDSGTTLSMPAAELARLHAHASDGYPHEVVGILAGSRSDAGPMLETGDAIPLPRARTQDAA